MLLHPFHYIHYFVVVAIKDDNTANSIQLHLEYKISVWPLIFFSAQATKHMHKNKYCNLQCTAFLEYTSKVDI